MTEHPDLAELCAAFAVGSPVGDEPIRQHVDHCPACRERVETFLRDADFMMAVLAPDVGADVDDPDICQNWDQHRAEQRALQQTFMHAPIVSVEHMSDEFRDDKTPASIPLALTKHQDIRSGGVRQVYAIAAAVLVVIGAALAGYWYRGTTAPKLTAVSAPVVVPQAHADVDVLLNDRQALKRELSEQELSTAALVERIKKQNSEIDRLKQEKERVELTVHEGERTEQALKEENGALDSKLQTAQTALSTMQQTLLEQMTRNEQLTALVRERETSIQRKDQELQQDTDLLASDRDIRDLVTARNLYVAEVYDLDNNGGYRKPYARVFFTKDKSLIFYGYDLDKQTAVREASVYQAWGNRGPNRKDALNLGFLYEDSATNKRWVLKLNDPQTIQQIDAVFITLEPKGGSTKPTSKAILFASLRLPPNHP